MPKNRCTKSIEVNGLKLPFNRYDFYQMVDGGPVRVRHRSQLSDAWVLAVQKGVTLSPFNLEYYLNSHTAPKNAIMGMTSQARTSMPRPMLGEGGRGYVRPPVDELRVLMSTHRGGGTAYESLEDRVKRSRLLVKAVVRSDPEALAGMVRDLRAKDNLRGASLALAVDALVQGHPEGYALLTESLQRPDDPAAALSYYQSVYGRKLPARLKKALAEGAVRLYTEDTVARFNLRQTRNLMGSPVAGADMTDVVRLTHPQPAGEIQIALFEYLSKGARLRLLHEDMSLRVRLPRLTSRADLLAQTPYDAVETFTEVLDAVQDAFHEGHIPTRREMGLLADVSMDDVLAWAGRMDTSRNLMRQTVKAGLKDAQKHLAETQAELMGIVEQGSRWTDEAQTLAGKSDRLRSEITAFKDELKELKGLNPNLRSQVMEVCLPKMSPKQILRSVLDVKDMSAGAIDYAAERLSDSEARKASTIQPSDVLLAVKALMVGRERLSSNEDSYYNDYEYGFGSWLMNIPDPSKMHTPVTASNKAMKALFNLSEAIPSPLRTAFDGILEEAAASLPELPKGRKLVLVDASGSMSCALSRVGDSRPGAFDGVTRAEAAALFAAMLRSRGEDVDVVSYDTKGTLVPLPGSGILHSAARIIVTGEGGGTDTFGTMLNFYDDHAVTIVITDEQTTYTPWDDREADGYNYGYRYYDNTYGAKAKSTPDYDEKVAKLKESTIITFNISGDTYAHAPKLKNMITVTGLGPSAFEALGAALADSKQVESDRAAEVAAAVAEEPVFEPSPVPGLTQTLGDFFPGDPYKWLEGK